MNDAVEQEIQAKGLTAPRITPADVENSIDRECYFTAAQGFLGEWSDSTKGPRENNCPPELYRITFCMLVLKNGFVVTGESACVFIENFNAEEGKKAARANAANKIWPLLGFRLRDQLTTLP